MNADPWAVVRLLGARVLELEHQRRATDRAAKAAITVNRAASTVLTESVLAYRALAWALVDNAGTDSRTTLAEAVAAAAALLELEAAPGTLELE